MFTMCSKSNNYWSVKDNSYYFQVKFKIVFVVCLIDYLYTYYILIKNINNYYYSL